MKIGVYVGSFNPPHIGHKQVINIILNKKIVDKVLIVPTNSYWDKKIDVPVEDRINMLKYLESENVSICSKLSDKEYTYEVLNELNKKYNNLYLVIGADNIISFNKWKNVNDILKHHVIVVDRNEIDINKYLLDFDKSKFIICKDVNIDVSSTKIRNNIKNKDYDSLYEIMDKRIIDYIKKNKLYME